MSERLKLIVLSILSLSRLWVDSFLKSLSQTFLLQSPYSEIGWRLVTEWELIGKLELCCLSTDANKNAFSLFETQGILASFYLSNPSNRLWFASSNSEYSYLRKRTKRDPSGKCNPWKSVKWKPSLELSLTFVL